MDELEKKLLSRIAELKQMREQANMQLMAINTTIRDGEPTKH